MFFSPNAEECTVSITSISMTPTRAEVREMVRSWAVASGSTPRCEPSKRATRTRGRRPYRGLVELGTFGVAVPKSAAAPAARSLTCA